MSWNDFGIGTHTCGVPVVEGLRVSLGNDDLLAIAGADALGIGVTRNDQDAGEDVGVAYHNKPGTVMVIAAGAVSVGQDVYAAAGGKVEALPVLAGDYIKVGVAMEAAAEDGDLIEVVPNEPGKIVTV
ncbi:capsid cement protein [Desulfovibrio oxyclinae]|uniref:capsid cement protein n=1 Tax=Desulfovibrio oxyclinae TaxID=63560 RepID=UPI00037BB118|nr:capsid cement protein [Desulfovibrio oxyclinae]